MISVYATYPLYDMCPGLEVELFPENVHIAGQLMRGIARDRRPWEVSMIAVCHVLVRSSTVSAYEPQFTLSLSLYSSTDTVLRSSDGEVRGQHRLSPISTKSYL